MNTQELLKSIVDIHNIISDIKVNGDDAIRMGAALSGLRDIAKALSEQQSEIREGEAE